jgi:hypothetical protein
VAVAVAVAVDAAGANELPRDGQLGQGQRDSPRDHEIRGSLRAAMSSMKARTSTRDRDGEYQRTSKARAPAFRTSKPAHRRTLS